jgi:signal peptidase I
MSAQLNLEVNPEPPDGNSNGNYRRPLVAAVMSACLPGFGQLYNGQANRAIWLFVAFCLFVAPAAAFVALMVPAFIMAPVLALWLVASIGLWIWNIWDAWRGAKRLRTPARSWHLSGLYAAIFLVCVGLILPSVTRQVCSKLVRPVKIVSSSMSPSLHVGDHLFVDMRVNCIGCAHQLTRGDIVVFTFPNNRNQLHIKRLIGLPGDQIKLSSQGVIVNGKPLFASPSDGALVAEQSADRSWMVTPAMKPEKTVKAETLTVPNGHAYLLGDNRGASKDSRAYGAVPLADIRGKARQIYFSSNTNGVNWSRVGQLVN